MGGGNGHHHKEKGDCMKLLGYRFGNVCQASGATGFWGEGYPVDRILRFIPGYSWRGAEFTAKTVTIHERAGKMPLKKNGATPKELLPRCIHIGWRKRAMLNAVGLSNLGLPFYLDRWSGIRGPFRISFMPVGETREKRVEECQLFAAYFSHYERLHPFRTAIALELNCSCPNLGREGGWTAGEIREYLHILSGAKMPIETKFGATFPPEQVVEVSASEHCAAVNGINTVPFGAFPEMIPWEKLYGRKGQPLESPLMRRPGIGLPGGFSGPWIKPVALSWVREVAARGCHKPIIGGGGILRPEDVDEFSRAGAEGVSLGATIKFFAPWNLARTIRRAHAVFAEKEHRAERPSAPVERAMV